MPGAKFERDGLCLSRALLEYVRESTVRESEAQRQLRLETAALPDAAMMTPPEQGQLMALLARLLGARRIVEVGTYTGYGTSWLAGALAPGGRVVTCEIEPGHLERARRAWQRAGLAERIEARLGPAARTLRELAEQGWRGRTDLVFVDADKTGYFTYYELGLELLRPGGLMLFDNVLWGGAVIDPAAQDPSTRALRAIVRHAAADPRVHCAVLTDGDGLLAVLKRPPPAGS